jgi:rfaE bifunctional protein kinase chain/domain
MANRERYRALIRKLGKARIVVVGDIVADIYVFGKPHRLSREAPVIVVRHESERLVPGSAANTANNLMALGATVYPIGVIGDDAAGRAVAAFFDNSRTSVAGIIVEKSRPTITKTRIMAGDLHTTKQQVIRIDKEPSKAIPAATEERLCEQLKIAADKADAIIVSDYGYDAVGPQVVKLLRRLAREKIVVVDSRARLNELKGVTLATPNESEVEHATGLAIETDADAITAGERLLKRTGDTAILMTRGNRGMILFEKGARPETIPICGGDEIVDVSGAGDTVAATATLTLAAGGTFSQAAHLANLAASVVVMKSGTATATPEEVLRVIERGPQRKRSTA